MFTNPRTGNVHKLNKGKPLKEVWRDPSQCVLPGLAPSITSMMARVKAGLPASIPSRTLETYYKNQDLTDVQETANAYKKLLAKVSESERIVKEAKAKAAKEREMQSKQLQEFLEKQKSEAAKEAAAS